MHSNKRFLIAFAAGLCAQQASAIVNGFNPAAAPVVNPATGQTTQVWKLVGKVVDPVTGHYSSAVQIAPTVILSVNHALKNGQTFTNVYGSSTAQNCIPHTTLDYVVCRLATPISVPANEPFPPIVSLPESIRNASATYGQAMRDFGSVLGVGFSTGTARAGWVAFDGLTYATAYAVGSDTADKNLLESAFGSYAYYLDPNPAPYATTGDSGGGVFWFSPNGVPALVGHFKGRGSIIGSPLFYSTELVAWLQNKLQTQSLPALTTRTFEQHAEGSLFTGPRMTVMPQTSSTGVTHTQLTWSAPTPLDSRPITDFVVTLSTGGQVERTIVRSSAARSIDFNNLAPATKYFGCVTPRNSSGAGTNVVGITDSAEVSSSSAVMTYSCNVFISGTPPVVTSVARSYPLQSNSTRTGNISWAVPTFNGLSGYVVRLTIKDGSSSTTTDYFTPSNSISIAGLPGNKTLCSSVYAKTTAGVLSDAATEVCFTP